MKLKKKRSKSVKKTIFTLCLTLTMVFYNHIPVFAQDYVLNPGLEQGDVIDENLMNQTVWAGYDTFSAIDGYREDHGYVSNKAVRVGDEEGYLQSDVSFNALRGILCTDKERDLIKQAFARGIYI